MADLINDYENLLQSGESQDIGSAIQQLISANITDTKTAFLATIQSINGNKISFKQIMKQKESDDPVIVNNVMIAFQYSQKWQEQFKLEVGDIGLVIITQDDISSYKKTGAGGVCNTRRAKDINDAIYIPCSLFKSLNNADINYILESFDKVCKLEFNNENIGTLKAKLLVLQSETTTLKKKLNELTELLEAMASGNTSPDSEGHIAVTAPASIGKFKSWYNSLDELFKE